jgi:hypothetical protein
MPSDYGRDPAAYLKEIARMLAPHGTALYRGRKASLSVDESGLHGPREASRVRRRKTTDYPQASVSKCLRCG